MLVSLGILESGTALSSLVTVGMHDALLAYGVHVHGLLDVQGGL